MDSVLYVEDYADVVPALKTAGITPDSVYAEETDILTRHQVDEKGDYYYLYNYNKKNGAGTAYPDLDKSLLTEKDLTVTLQGEGRPYAMNAWTGEITPIAEYTIGDGTITLKLHFDEDEAKLVAILPDAVASAEGLAVCETYATDSEADVAYADDGSLLLKSVQGGIYPVTLGEGSTIQVAIPSVQDAFAIDEWNLQINSMHEGKSVAFRDSEWTMLEPMTVTKLDSWKNLNPDWAKTVGIGTYTATFTLDKGWDEGCGVTISLGEVEDTYTVTVNGVKLPMVDQINTTVDIGKYVKAGENTIKVEVSSVIGARNGFGMFGVNGEVIVTPYAVAAVKEAVQSVCAPEAVTVGESFEMTVVTSDAVEGISLYNEYDMELKVQSIGIENGDGTKTWTLSTAIGTVGNGRTIKVIPKAGGYCTFTGASFTTDVLSIPPAISNFDLPDTAVANRTFIVKATTDMAATKIAVYNEYGTKMGVKSLSYKVVDGQKAWTGVMAIGTKGDRTFTAYAVNKYGVQSEALTDNISVKAFA